MNWLTTVAVLTLTFMPLISTQSTDDYDYQGYRLPETLIPSHYEVDLILSETALLGQNSSYDGSVEITFVASASTNQIQLHHLDLTFRTVALTASSGTTVGITSYDTYNTTSQILTIITAQNLVAGTEYLLKISFVGTLRTDLTGFYISTYINSSGSSEYLLTTQFEPVYARRAFPCFDEPQFKATFSISITYPVGYNALSNTAQSSLVSVSSTQEKAVFLKTPITPTYLVAFIISKFTCTEGDAIQPNVPHRVCSRPNTDSDRALAVQIGPPIMRQLESITGINYGDYIGKMDQVAIPDFNSGAMENWGLVTYRETGLLWDSETSSNSYKESIALVVAHEFTHMWFGNLVTLKWWDYTFLNEGFARFYQYLAAAQVDYFKDWQLDLRFTIVARQAAMLTDASLSANSLTSKASTPSQISGKFDNIGYAKGASVIYMIQHLMGTNSFNLAIKDYLKTYATKNTVSDDLWNKFATYAPSSYLPSNTTFNEMIKNWSDEGGCPVVTATASGNNVVLSQKRFLLSGNSTTEWYVPVSYTLSSDRNKFASTNANVWLIPGQTVTLSNVLNGNDWIVLNNQQTGYYRVNYDSTLWEKIKTVLNTNHSSIHVTNRAQIVNDILNFARSGLFNYSEAFEIMKYLQHETDYHVWYSAQAPLTHLFTRIGYQTTIGQQLSAFLLDLMQHVYSTLSLDQLDADDHVYSINQILVSGRMCKYGDSGCISKVKNIYSQFRNNGVTVNKNLKTVVYCYALKHSDDIDTDFNYLWNKYQETTLATERLTILNALGCTTNSTYLKWYLDQTVNASSGIRTQDFSYPWSSVYTNSKEGIIAALEYIIENHEKMNAYSSGSASSYISSVASYVSSEDELTQLVAFANATSTPANLKQAATNAITSARQNMAWAANVKEDLAQFLADNGYSDSAAPKSVRISMLFAIILVTFVQIFK